MKNTSKTESYSDASFLIVGSTRTDNGSESISRFRLADHVSLINNAIVIAEDRKDMMVVHHLLENQ